MDSGSDSDQDSACSSSGEDASYNQGQQPQQQQQQQKAPNSSQHSDYQSMMKYMQQQQQQQQQSDSSQQQQNEQLQHHQQQQMMMLPFMMPGSSSFQMMMQAQGGMPPYFGQNMTNSPTSRESETATGSPLNLQTLREDRPSSRTQQPARDYQNMAQPFAHDQSQQQQMVPISSARTHQVVNAAQSPVSRTSPQSALPCTLPNTVPMSSGHLGMSKDHQMAQQSVGNFSSVDFGMAAQRQEPPKPEPPAPPKRPLTPYMRFSKCMWQQVKSTNPGMSVCEIGATIGRMWRELSNEEKQKHNDDFTLDKVRYDNELKSYLKSTGLHASDLVKSKGKKKDIQTKPPVRRPPPPQQSRPAASSLENQTPNQQVHQQQQQQLAQSFLGLPIPGMSGSLPMGVGMPMGMLPGFPQMWAAPGQQYPSQQMLASMNVAGQLQFAQHHAQGLYNNGGAATSEPGSVSQLTTGTEGGGQLPSVYLYSPNYM